MNINPDAPTCPAQGRPGDCFLASGDSYDPSAWVIWRVLDGEELNVARECGYTPEKYPTVIAAVLAGNNLNLPHPLKTDQDDPPRSMTGADDPIMGSGTWTYLGQI